MCCCCRPVVHGLIFLFKWKDDDDMEGSVVRDSRLDNIFFAKQVDSVLCLFSRCHLTFHQSIIDTVKSIL